MITLLKALAFNFVAGRTVGGVMTLLLMLAAPLAAVLKFIGVPALLVLGIVGAPLFTILAAIGLPAMFVVGIGGVIMLFVGLFIAAGIFAIKIALPIILIVWFVRWLRRSPQAEPVVASTVEPEAGSL